MNDSLARTSSKDLLVITCTHGDEQFANVPVTVLKAQFGDRFDWIIGNPRAMEQNVRYTEKDLNRVAPGKQKDAVYEVNRAYEILRQAEAYPYVIDIHGTVADCGIFTLVANPKIENIALAASLPVENIVLWVSNDERAAKEGPLAPAMQCAVAIECGPKNDPKIAAALLSQMRIIIRDGISLQMGMRVPKNIFRVSGRLPEEQKPVGVILKDFEEVELNGESFYPLLSGQYDGVACYKMQKMDLWDQFGYWLDQK